MEAVFFMEAAVFMDAAVFMTAAVFIAAVVFITGAGRRIRPLTPPYRKGNNYQMKINATVDLN